MSKSEKPGTLIRLTDLNASKHHAFDIEPSKSELKDLAGNLELLHLRKLHFIGKLQPLGKKDWRLTAHLGATVEQACIATLEPVTTRIETDIERLYTADYADIDAPEAEMPEDDTVEPLPQELDLNQILAEALSLALPLYPRAETAETIAYQHAAPGVAPLKDEDLKPFAGLAALKDRLKGSSDPE